MNSLHTFYVCCFAFYGGFGDTRVYDAQRDVTCALHMVLEDLQVIGLNFS